MISEDLLGPRDVLRTRLRLVQRCVSAQNSVDRLLEKFNVTEVETLPPLYRAQAALHQAQITLLRTQRRELERLIQPALLENADIQRLLWIPGIGRLAAFTIYLEVDGMARFPTIRHFWSYCRLVPGADDSANRRRHRSGSKDGDRYLKVVFSHAAIRAAQYFPEIRHWYQRWKRKKPLAVARTLVAKELAQSVYAVLKEQVDFNQPVQRHAAHAAETSAVAPSGEPARPN